MMQLQYASAYTNAFASDNMTMNTMQLQDILFSQGFGTRRVCAGLIQQGFVALGQEICTLPARPMTSR